MIIIAHRGNLHGPSNKENEPLYLKEAIAAGFDVEVDIWLIGDQYFLGHDEPTILLANGQKFIKEIANHAWFHAKNLEALNAIKNLEVYNISLQRFPNVFWHENDKFTLTSHGDIWTYPGQNVCPRSIIVQIGRPNKFIDGTVAGVCTDYAAEY